MNIYLNIELVRKFWYIIYTRNNFRVSILVEIEGQKSNGNLILIWLKLANELKLSINKHLLFSNTANNATTATKTRPTHAHNESVQIRFIIVLVELGLATLDRLEQGVVNEYELLFGLNQIIPLVTYVLQECVYVNGGFRLYLLHHGVNDYVSSRATHACRAVNDNWATKFRIWTGWFLDEWENWHDVIRNAVIGPISKMKLIHQTFAVASLLI